MEIPASPRTLPSSFRDPAGFLFERDGVLYRRVNAAGLPDYGRLVASGLLAALRKAGTIVPHEEADPAEAGFPPSAPGEAPFKILRPERIPFVSYPFEWCHSALRDAALLTLDLAVEALGRGMTLRDASAYNLQFRHGKPLLIDTLSFGAYAEGAPWDAYGQFCRHFLAPLALGARVDIRLQQLSRVHLDGVPLDLASRLLPFSTRFRFGLLTHLHLHAGATRRHERAGTGAAKRGRVSRMGLLGILAGLRSTVAGLRWNPAGTEWGDYYGDTNYDAAAFEAKRSLVAGFVASVKPSSVWDLGANDGTFSRIAAETGAHTVAFDIDPAAVEKNYRRVRERGERNLLPLLLDLTNPSPGLGFEGRERAPVTERGKPDLVLALALVHHLAISNNLPLPRLADFFASLAPRLVLEWVPKQDSKARLLLATREDIFPGYTREGFEAAFLRRFRIARAEPIPGSERILYLFERHPGSA